MNELKNILFDSYGGFADKRINNLEKSNRFIIDDRSEADVGANGQLYSYFCMIFADVISNREVFVSLVGNIPVGTKVKSWIKENNCEIKEHPTQSRLEIYVKKDEQSKLNELAISFQSIVAPGAPRYSVANYKYVCPRTSKSLNSFVNILNKAWSTNKN